MPAPWWRPDRFAQRRAYLTARTKIVDATRGFFRERGFEEVETPALQVSPGLEPHLQAFRTELKAPGGAGAPRYLHTSPEFAMKKLLAAGMERIFQLARVYRNGERSATHHPEFTMLEWYRAHADYTALMDDVDDLLKAVATREFEWNGKRCDPRGGAERLLVADAFAREGIDILAATSLESLTKAAQPLGIAP